MVYKVRLIFSVKTKYCNTRDLATVGSREVLSASSEVGRACTYRSRWMNSCIRSDVGAQITNCLETPVNKYFWSAPRLSIICALSVLCPKLKKNFLSVNFVIKGI